MFILLAIIKIYIFQVKKR